MDDDLMSLRGGRSANGGDDLFGSFSDPDDLGFDSPSPSAKGSLPDLDDPLDFSGFDEPSFSAPAPAASRATAAKSKAAPAKRAKATKTKRRRRSGASAQRGFMGLTPPQMMILSIFLFLDIAVLGFFVLIAIGAVNIPF